MPRMNTADSPNVVTDTPSPAMILALAAELREDAIKDKTYRLTPIGNAAGKWLDELTFNNYSPKTIENYEHTVAWLALDYANLELADVTTDMLKEFLVRHWRSAAPTTRGEHASHLRNFFAWAHDEGLIAADPAGRRLKSPRSKDTERRSHSRDIVRRLVVAQDSRRDRVAILLLYWCALRRNELRQVQFRHIDLARRMLTVFGKGGTVIEQNIPETVALDLERYILDSQAEPHFFLLHPQKVGQRGSFPNYTLDVVWADRARPLTSSAMDKWWQRCVARAGLPHFPMHEMRHTGITHFHETGGDLAKTQHYARHKNPATTARVYVHLDRAAAIAEVQRDMVDPLTEDV